MIIRAGKTDDATAIAAFWHPLIRETVITFSTTEHAPDAIAKMITDNPAFLVAVRDGTVVGFATYKQFRAGNGYRHSMEHTIIVDPVAQRGGVASALMDALETHARGEGVHTLIGGVTGTNTEGIKFHQARGYKLAGVIAQTGRKFDRWLDLHLMQKML